MSINEVAPLESWLLSNQSEQFKKLLKSSDWLDKKPAFSKSHLVFGHVNRL